MANPILNEIPVFVDQNKTGLIQETLLGNKSSKLFNLIPEVKTPTSLNLLNTDVAIQDGSECGWSDDGDSTISQRILTPAILKINQSFCDKQLIKTWKAYEVKLSLGQKTLPFAEDFIKGVNTEVSNKIEKMIYQGESANDAECTGLIEILETDLSGTTNIMDFTSGASVYNAIKDVYLALPDNARREDTAILVSAGAYEKFIQEVVSANLYHFDPSRPTDEFYLPGTNVKVIKTSGLNGTSDYEYIIATYLNNIYVGFDNVDADYDFWYEKGEREYRLAIDFAVGVQVAFPSDVILGRIAK